MRSFLDTPIMYLKGVGEKRAKSLADEFEISTFRDLLYYFPFRYVDRSRFYRIAEFFGEMPMVQVRGHFIRFDFDGEGAKRRLVGIFTDGERMMNVIWFSKVNALKDAYKPGVEYVLFGKPQMFRSDHSMVHPEVTPYNPENPPTGFQGVYTIPDKAKKKFFTVKAIGKLVANLIEHPQFSTIPETLPAEVLEAYHLMPLQETLRNLHLPESPERLQKARERMKFEELFYLQLHILRFARERGRRIKGLVFPVIGEYFNRFYAECIPFELTGAQKRVLKEIRADMRTGRQMNRLVQGDVGSGKTMVAFMSMLMAKDNG